MYLNIYAALRRYNAMVTHDAPYCCVKPGCYCVKHGIPHRAKPVPALAWQGISERLTSCVILNKDKLTSDMAQFVRDRAFDATARFDYATARG